MSQYPIPTRKICYANSLPSFDRVFVDWKETEEAHVFTVDAPGLKKDQVKVEIENRSHLRISSKKQNDKVILFPHYNGNEDTKPETLHLRERSSGIFDRKFELPENAKFEEVSAAMKDGVLTVTIPKRNTNNIVDLRSIPISG